MLKNTNANDQNLTSLVDLKHLNTLNLFGTQVTKKSIAHLAKMKGLEVLFIGDTPLHTQRLDSLQQLLPGFSIN